MLAGARDVDRNAGDVRDVVSDISTRADAATRTSGETSQNVQSVAGATKQFAASLNEISAQVNRYAEMAGRAKGDTARTSAIVVVAGRRPSARSAASSTSSTASPGRPTFWR